METFLSVYTIFWAGILAALIYLVIRRIRLHKKEDFEKREH